MKRILLNLILLLMSAHVIAQTFTGLVDGNKWTFYCTVSINPDEYDTDYYWEQEVKGDTIIDGCTYKKVYNKITGWENTGDIDKPSVLFFCQEGDKVYEWKNGERVLNYDFNLQAGDSFYTNYDMEMVVDSVSYKSMPNNQSLKHLYVSMSEEHNLSDVWVEGIGSMTDGLNESSMGRVGSGRKLISFISQGEELLNNSTHEYIPLLLPDNVWVETGYQAYAQYAISDTIDINGVEYSVVGSTEMSLPDKEIVVNNQKVYIREEGKKVYRYDDSFAQEYLLFDFGAEEGDTIDSSISSEYKRFIVVDSIRSATLDAKERKVYYVTYFINEESFLNDVWIEGIGSTQTFLFNDIIRWGGSGYSYFNYFYDRNTQYIYPEDATLYDFGTSATHEYIPFVEDGKVWVDYDDMEYYTQVGIYGTTTIDQTEYHNLYIESYDFLTSAKTDSKLYGYIREEDKKVYIRNLNDTQEYLIYDFGVQAGDTIDWTTYRTDIDNSIAVDSIKTDAYYGQERNVYYVTYIEKESNGETWFVGKDVWIEGVGSLEYPIMSVLDDRYRWGATGMLYFKYCYNYNTQEIFPTTATPYQQFSYPAPASVNNVNRAKEALTLHCTGDVLMAAFPTAGKGEVITLYDATGRAVACQPIREGATTASINVATLPQGVYIARLSSGATVKVAM